MNSQPYNPLEKENLAKSIELKILSQSPIPLSNVETIAGAGIYVIYYSGQFEPYA